MLAGLAALCLTGCGSQIEFTWAMERVPNNLDPQLAWESPELIAVTNLCTHCNPDILFSHRAQGDRRGNLSALLALKE